jgi:hypothetical protein
MGTSLFNTTPAATYPALIKVGDNTSIDGTLKTLSDGAGNDLPIQVSSTATNFTQNVGIGTTTPTARLRVISADTNGIAEFFQGGNTASPLHLTRYGGNVPINLNTSGGTSASPTPLGDNSAMSRLSTNTYNGTAFGTSARIEVFSKGIQSATNYGSSMRFFVTAENATTTSEVLSLLSSGNVQINESISNDRGSKLFVKGGGSTSATTSLLVQNSLGNNAMQITDNFGIIFAGKGQDNSGVYIGRNVAANWTNSAGSTVIGDAADVSGNAINQVIIGKEAIGSATGNINIGYRAGVSGGSNGNSILIGNAAGQHGAALFPTSPIGIGGSVSVGGTNSIAIGTSSKSNASNSVAIGNLSEVYFNPSYSATNGIAIGANSFANQDGRFPDATAIAIGYDSYASYYEFVSGAPTFPIKDVYFGSGAIRKNGLSNGVGVAYTINGSGAFGTNFAGGDLTLAGGKGTGSGTAGNLIFSTSTVGSSGTTLQTLTERMRIDGSGNVGIGTTTPVSLLSVNGRMNLSNTNANARFIEVRRSSGYLCFGNTAGAESISMNGSTLLVGVEPDTQSARVQIKGSGSTSATTSLLVQNSLAATTFSVNDAGELSLPSTAPKITLGGDLTITSTVSPTRLMIYDVTNGNLSVNVGGVGEGYFIGNRFTLSRASTTYVTPDALNATGGAFITAYDSNGNIAINASNNGNRSIALRGLGASGAVLIGNITTANGTSYSAILQADSTTQGFLPPRMTTLQRNAIASPPNGLIVFDTDVQNLCYRRDSTWVQVSFTAV